MVTSQTRFRSTDNKLINLMKCLQEFKNSMQLTNCDSNNNKDKYASFASNEIFQLSLSVA